MSPSYFLNGSLKAWPDKNTRVQRFETVGPKMQFFMFLKYVNFLRRKTICNDINLHIIVMKDYFYFSQMIDIESTCMYDWFGLDQKRLKKKVKSNKMNDMLHLSTTCQNTILLMLRLVA